MVPSFESGFKVPAFPAVLGTQFSVPTLSHHENTVLTLGELRQEDSGYQASLGYITRPCFEGEGKQQERSVS